jgi:GT2 family glycosyltransferase
MLSIIIPVYNKINFTLSAINDIFKLETDYELIVVDNASTDDTQKKLTEIQHPRFTYIRNEDNLFHSKGCNVGYAASKGSHVLFINNDIKVRSEYATWTNHIIDNCYDNIVGPTFGQLDKDFNFIKESNQVLIGNSYISGWCIAAKKETWNKLDLSLNQVWNESLPMYFNDGDLSFRARKLNIKMDLISLPVVHFGKISSSQLNVNKLYNEGKKIFCKKWLKK